MTDIVKFLADHWVIILEILGGLVAVASVITGATSSPKDDGVVAFFQKVLGYLSALTHKDEPGTLSAPLVQGGDEPLMFERASRK